MKAIYNCKVLDPACGSGAFPMGMLQQMVHVLKRLDPTNEMWKQLMIDRAIEQSRVAFSVDSKAERRERLDDIENAFNQSINDPDYARKLFLIENCIYGVDIQPIATQISKLRFFISLVVDQKPTDDARNNFGIRPLPNLESKFVAANTLIPVQYDSSLVDTADEVIKHKNRLKELNHKIFLAKRNTDKQRLKSEIKDTRMQLAKAIADTGFVTDGDASKLAAWDMFDQNTSSDFFDPEWMFGVKGGFDVVIGNPPYGAGLTDGEKEFFKNNYVTAKTIKGKQKGSLDTYTLFIEKGFDSLAKFGVLHYIIPISITSSDSLTGVHELLFNNCEDIRISSYAVRPKPVFENAMVNTSILSFEKTLKHCTYVYSTKMYRRSERFNLQSLVDNLRFVEVSNYLRRGRIPKIGLQIEKDILKKLNNFGTIESYLCNDGNPIMYRFAGGRYFKVVTNYYTDSSAERVLILEKKYSNSIGCILSSNLSFWLYQIYSDNLNWKDCEITSVPIPNLTENQIAVLEKMYCEYLEDIERNANIRKSNGKSAYHVSQFKEYKIVRSKKIIDKIDDFIGPLYGLDSEEIEFIKNYELEFRMSGDD